MRSDSSKRSVFCDLLLIDTHRRSHKQCDCYEMQDTAILVRFSHRISVNRALVWVYGALVWVEGTGVGEGHRCRCIKL